MTGLQENLIKLPELPVIEIVDDPVQVYKEFMVIRAALQLKLFDWIAANGPATITEISKGTGIVEEYLAGLVGMLYYLDMVRRNGEEYLISPSAELHFVSSSLYYQGDIILALSAKDSPWAAIDEYITKPDSRVTFEPENEYAVRSTAEQEVRGMVKNITNVISRWPGFKEAASLCEFGSGHGLYSIAACQLNPDLKAYVYHEPGSLLLRENIARFGMEGRVIPFDDRGRPEEGAPYDIILASHILYQDQAQLGEKVRSMANSLKEGGLFVSNHWFGRESEGTGMQGLYELELALHNRYHMIRDRNGFEEICLQNGLALFQTGMMRTSYGESTIHMATRTRNPEEQ
jgi:hypothetical protein